MNELERLKKAMEAEPMAVLVMPWLENGCAECDLCSDIDKERNMALCRYYDSYSIMVCGRLPSCPLRPAIGIIEPNGHVVYLREEEE